MKKFWKKNDSMDRKISTASLDDFDPPTLFAHHTLSNGDREALKKLVNDFQQTGVLERSGDGTLNYSDDDENLEAIYLNSIENGVSEISLTPEKYSKKTDDLISSRESETAIEDNPYVGKNLFDINE